jgi:small subunit ribosomal protein S3
MIERKFVEEKMKEFQIQEFIASTLSNAGHSHTKLVRTPLGEKIVIFASRPGIVVGKKGENIKKLTITLKKKFKLENPQIEISEIENPNLDAQIVAERIASTLERFGIQKFKGVGHKTMSDVINSGALGIEIKISGKVPSSRAKSWRFYQGYLKKSGDISLEVRKAYTSAKLKSGIVGIQVSIMPPDIDLPDRITIKKKDEETKAGDKTEPAKIENAAAEAAKEGAEKKIAEKAAEPKEKKKRARKPRKKKADEKAEEKSEGKETKVNAPDVKSEEHNADKKSAEPSE